MLGFAIVDRQPKADATAVWLTCREGSRVSHTNAVVIPNDDVRYDIKIWNLTAYRIVVLTGGTVLSRAFQHSIGLDALDGFADETAAHRRNIEAAAAEYATRTKKKNLVTPEFPRERPALTVHPRDQPEFRALSVANYVAAVWSAWLATDEQRVRRVINPRTGTAPWIMPESLGSSALAEFPPRFAKLLELEPVTRRPST